MYCNLTLYYLEKIGITPWIDRGTTPCKNAKKLLILLEKNPENKELSLLKRILFFLNIDDDNYVILSGERGGMDEIKDTYFLAALVFSKEDNRVWLQQRLSHIDVRNQIFTISPAAELIRTPILKKEIFMQLNRVRSVLFPDN